MNRHLLLLAFCQGMFLTNTVTFIAVNGLAGLALAPVGWMATLPVTTYVIGGGPKTPPKDNKKNPRGEKHPHQPGGV